VFAWGARPLIAAAAAALQWSVTPGRAAFWGRVCQLSLAMFGGVAIVLALLPWSRSHDPC